MFALGCDRTADLWSLGIVLYELYCAITPFENDKQGNAQAVFHNIRAAKEVGFKLPVPFDMKVKEHDAKDLIVKLLQYEPRERVGADDTSVILDHQYFEGVDIDALFNGTEQAHFVPPPLRGKSISTVPPINAYSGDQSIFAVF